MINKERYLDILSHILWEHYNEIKLKKSVSEEQKKYIEGYMAAARALDIFSHEELKEVIDKMHLKVFGKTIQERRLSESNNTSSINGLLDIPTFIREGVSLDKK